MSSARRRTLARLCTWVWLTVLLLTAVALSACPDPRHELQTVVKVRDRTVVVRYEDGRLAEVLNDMDYELAPDQQVKVVENCDGRLHVAVAYAVR